MIALRGNFGAATIHDVFAIAAALNALPESRTGWEMGEGLNRRSAPGKTAAAAVPVSVCLVPRTRTLIMLDGTRPGGIRLLSDFAAGDTIFGTSDRS
jgi:hypothetical protein